MHLQDAFLDESEIQSSSNFLDRICLEKTGSRLKPNLNAFTSNVWPSQDIFWSISLGYECRQTVHASQFYQGAELCQISMQQTGSPPTRTNQKCLGCTALVGAET